MDEDKLLAKIDKIIELLHESKHSVRRLLVQEDITASVFYNRLHKYPLIHERYLLAQESRAELMVDDIVDIADNEPDPQTARNRIDVRKWYASKMMPSKYGERIDLNVNQTIDIVGALNAARTRILNPSAARLTQGSEIVEEKPSKDRETTDSESVDAGHNLPNIFS